MNFLPSLLALSESSVGSGWDGILSVLLTFARADEAKSFPAASYLNTRVCPMRAGLFDAP